MVSFNVCIYLLGIVACIYTADIPHYLNVAAAYDLQAVLKD